MTIVLIILGVLVVVTAGIVLQGRTGPRQHDPLASEGSVRVSPEERQDGSPREAWDSDDAERR